MNLATPLILTLVLDAQSTEFFDALRLKHYPPERNWIKSHLTLIHQLPNCVETIHTVERICSEQQRFDILVANVMRLGNGVAFSVESQALMQLHQRIRSEFYNELTRQPFRPHITIQNKVKPEVANELYNQLNQNFQPFHAPAKAISVHEYRGGPWVTVREFSFGS
jgi:2'-5' RNA ligase